MYSNGDKCIGIEITNQAAKAIDRAGIPNGIQTSLTDRVCRRRFTRTNLDESQLYNNGSRKKPFLRLRILIPSAAAA